ncbi:Cell division cycle-associated 7-like protein [Actinidia chinensis var. chinensis]|uniref:Cell division cycle-associated 7-like protein n=1 Tax=Actinidia chinensis var. chinensis TaxID=1590841 RepID=A0A2R6P9Y2_ACTCC|nr:Cell division cycle-associated 7-like protein [Actinidia chinensis var. chinensis]
MALGADSASKLAESEGKIGESEGKREEKSLKKSDDDLLSPEKIANNGDRISDPKNWKTCHQCRQKTMDFVAACKNQKKDKPCPIKFCRKCLMNRYGEKAEEMSGLEDWNCPKCRGICNCSYCRKKQGHLPTGILVHAARATGFSSVSELLLVKGPGNFGIEKIPKGIDNEPTNADASNHESAITLPRKRGKENSFCGSNTTSLHPELLPLNLAEKKRKKIKHEEVTEIQERDHGDGLSLQETQDGNQGDGVLLNDSRPRKPRLSKGGMNSKDTCIPLPQGTELTTVAGIDLPLDDVGHALQFLEFCAAFEEILDLKEGEPEYVLRELIHGGRGCRGKYSPVVRFHIQLLSQIQEDLGEKSTVISAKDGKISWLRVLQNCASRSQCMFQNLKLEQFGWEADDYESLDSSKKLKLLNLLCDEFLCTAKTRSWIDDQNSKFAGEVKEAKERVLAAKHKEKQLKQKMQDEVAKAIIAKNGDPLSISEHEAIVSEIKTEAAQAHAEMLESKGMVPKGKQRSDAIRTEPILLDVDGRTCWRLRGYSDEPKLLLQDVGSYDAVGSDEKWFTYDVEQEKQIEKYILAIRKRRRRSENITDGLSSESSIPDLNSVSIPSSPVSAIKDVTADVACS